MKRIHVLSLLACTFLVACSTFEQRNEQKEKAAPSARFGYPGDTPNPEPEAPVERHDQTSITETAPPEPTPPPVVAVVKPTPPPAPPVEKAENKMGIVVPGKQGFVKSPYSPESGLVDVRGYPPNTEVRDPYTGKIFLVP